MKESQTIKITKKGEKKIRVDQGGVLEFVRHYATSKTALQITYSA